MGSPVKKYHFLMAVIGSHLVYIVCLDIAPLAWLDFQLGIPILLDYTTCKFRDTKQCFLTMNVFGIITNFNLYTYFFSI